MRSALLAAGVAAVFAVGIGVGVALSGGEPAQVAAPTPSGAGSAPPTAGPRVVFDAGGAAAGDQQGTSGAGPVSPAEEQGQDAGQDRPETPPPVEVFLADDVPPPPPPPVPAEGLEAEAALRREQAESEGGQGGGRVKTVLYDFEDDAERAAWEAKYRQRWEKRLRREIDIKLELLREKVGLRPDQEAALRSLLQDEYQERSRLVELLTAKQLGRPEFDAAVHANVAKAQQRLEATLSAEQLAVYQQLKPREKVLEEGVK